MRKWLGLSLFLSACTPYASSFEGDVPQGLCGAPLSQVSRRVVEQKDQEDNFMGKNEKMIRIWIKGYQDTQGNYMSDHYIYTDVKV